MLKRSAQFAARNQAGLFGKLRLNVKELEIRPLPPPPADVVACGVVAADAGQISIELSPFSLEFLFVADDTGTAHVAEFFPLSTLKEDVEDLFARSAVLAGFATALGVKWPDFSSVWNAALEIDPAFAPDVHLIANTLREIAEWAVCVHLAEKAPTTGPGLRRVVLHDGMLSSFLMRIDIVREHLPAWWRDEAWERRGVALAGVGKSSRRWEELAVALELDSRVKSAQDCYVMVGEDVEAVMGRRRQAQQRQGFGELALMRLKGNSPGYWLPVDLPPWIAGDVATREAVLAVIAQSSRITFPRPGYPAPLGRAHEAARLTSFDASVVKDLVVRALREEMDEAEFEKLLRGWAFQPAGWEKVGGLRPE